MKIISVFLFVTIFGFIFITIEQLAVHGIHKYNRDFDQLTPSFWHGDYYTPKLTKIEFFKSLSVIMVSFSCQQNLFPIFAELAKKTNSECQQGFGLATLMVGALYVLLAFITVFMFGSTVDASMLTDVGQECHTGDGTCPWESICLRIMFLVVLACHIPFIFFSGKEGLLIIIDEVDRRSISEALERKMERLGIDLDSRPSEHKIEIQPLISPHHVERGLKEFR